MTDPASHPLFAAHPINGTIEADGHTLPTPYHVHAGHGVFIAGIADVEAIRDGFKGQDVYPVLTESGAGVAGLFVCRFDRASHGPHLELQMTALAAPNPGQSIADRPEACIAALGSRPDWGLLSLSLWNDTAPVVAYNSAYLGLDARPCRGEVTEAGGRLAFRFRDTDQAPILDGNIVLNRRSGLREGVTVARLMGLRPLLSAARQASARAYLINRKGPVLPANRRALTLTAPDRMVLTRFDPGRDRLNITAPAMARLGFHPLCCEHLSPFRFVYLHPDLSGAAP